MNARLRTAFVANAAWFAGLLLVGGGLAFGALDLYGQHRNGVRERERAIAAKRDVLEQRTQSARAQEALGDAAADLEESRRWAGDRRLRVLELSKTAERCGVSLVAMRTIEPALDEERGILSCEHQIGVTGSYRQIATFLGAMSDAPGTVGIGNIDVERSTPLEVEGERLLVARLGITWYATVEAGTSATESGGQG